MLQIIKSLLNQPPPDILIQLCFCFKDRVSLCSTEWDGNFYSDQAGLEFTKDLELQAHTPLPESNPALSSTGKHSASVIGCYTIVKVPPGMHSTLSQIHSVCPFLVSLIQRLSQKQISKEDTRYLWISVSDLLVLKINSSENWLLKAIQSLPEFII